MGFAYGRGYSWYTEQELRAIFPRGDVTSPTASSLFSIPTATTDKPSPMDDPALAKVKAAARQDRLKLLKNHGRKRAW